MRRLNIFTCSQISNHPRQLQPLVMPYETDKRKEIYYLTERGLDLIPILLELVSWDAQHDPRTGAPQEWITLVNAKKEKMTQLVCNTVQRVVPIFSGPDSVVKKLAEERLVI
jgi:hypothetical protein